MLRSLCSSMVTLLGLILLLSPLTQSLQYSHRPTRLGSSLRMGFDPDRTIVVTGMGVVSPCGNTLNSFFDTICHGPSAVSAIDRFDASPFKCQIGAQIRDFDPRQYYKSKKRVKQNDRSTHYAVAAAHMALADAHLDLQTTAPTTVDAGRVGVILGSAFGGMETFERAALSLHENGPSSIDPYTVPQILGNTPAGIIAMETGARGPNFAVQTACATGTHALGEALRLLRAGDADVILAGGCEAPLTPLSFASFCNLMAMNTACNASPQTASRPFDLTRGGFVMGEGAGVLVLETLSHALKRGASTIYCELAGYGASCDAYHITSPEPEGKGLASAIDSCLRDAKMTPEDIQYVNAHGTSTLKNDLFETLALKRAFSEPLARALAISSIKGATGHSLGAAGALEAIATVLALQRSLVPPTLNLHTADPACDLDYVPLTARHMPQLQAALSENLGFGGHNGVVAFRKLR